MTAALAAVLVACSPESAGRGKTGAEESVGPESSLPESAGHETGETGDTGVARPTWAAIAVGLQYLCALDTAGLVACTPDAPAVDGGVAPVGKYLAMSAGFDHVCALDEASVVTCWGGDGFGQSTAFEGIAATQVLAMTSSTCMIDLAGDVSCAGREDRGIAEVPDITATHVSGNGYTACVLDDAGSPQCWGLDQFGSYPQPEDLSGAQEIAPAALGSALIDEQGKVRIFGGGQLGDPSTSTGDWHDLVYDDTVWCAIREYAVECSGGWEVPDAEYVALSGYVESVCGLTVQGEIKCWATSELADPGEVPDPDRLTYAE